MLARVPFRIDRMRPRALVRQMTDGLRDAIVTGYYKPGDRLPISLTRVEYNPSEAGASIAQAALDFLGGNEFSHDSASGFRYVIGDTFPDVRNGANR